MSRRKTINSKKAAAAAGGKTAVDIGRSGSDSEEDDVSDKMESGVFIVLKAPRLTKDATAKSVRKFLDDFLLYEENFAARKADGSIREEQEPEDIRRCVERKLLRSMCIYEMKVAVDALTEEQLLEHLKNKLKAVKNSTPIEILLGKLRFNKQVMEPQEKVRAVFEEVDDILEVNNLEGTYKTKQINKFIIKALQPTEVRETAEKYLNTVAGQEVLKDKIELFGYLVALYTDWYKLHPTGETRPRFKSNVDSGEKKEAGGAGKNRGRGRGGRGRNKSRGGRSVNNNGDSSENKKKAPAAGCWHCGEEHYLYECPTATATDRRKAIADKKGSAAAPSGKANRIREKGNVAEVMACINGAVEWPVAPDTQASSTIMTENTLREISDRTEIEVTDIETKQFQLADNKTVECKKKATLELMVRTSTSPVRLRRVTAYVIPGGSGAILLGMHELSLLGYQHPRDWFEELGRRGPIEVMADSDPRAMAEEMAYVAKRVKPLHGRDKRYEHNGEEEINDDDDETEDCIEEGYGIDGVKSKEELQRILEKELVLIMQRAEIAGAKKTTVNALKQLVLKFEDIFRMELGHDPPAKVEPMDVQLIDGEDLKMNRARRFSPLQMEFLDEHVRLLLEMKVIRKSKSNYASPIVLARKSDGSWRMCVDLRRINARTKAMPWPLPKINEILPHLAGAVVFATFDLLHGY